MIIKKGQQARKELRLAVSFSFLIHFSVFLLVCSGSLPCCSHKAIQPFYTVDLACIPLPPDVTCVPVNPARSPDSIQKTIPDHPPVPVPEHAEPVPKPVEPAPADPVTAEKINDTEKTEKETANHYQDHKDLPENTVDEPHDTVLKDDRTDFAENTDVLSGEKPVEGPLVGYASLLDLYKSMIREAVKANFSYSDSRFSKNPMFGTIVTFTVLPDGKIKNIRVVKPSGVQTLDYLANQAISKTVTAPPQPPGLNVPFVEMALKFAPD